MSLFLPSMYVQDNNGGGELTIGPDVGQVGVSRKYRSYSLLVYEKQDFPLHLSYIVNDVATWSRDREETRWSDSLNLCRERAITLVMSSRRRLI